ncbi:hypothetical protein SELMODRAFT_424220 [Selaginella moellendorffii]|uniref:Uncharacterized protein n=1 Tax=Selaginella moellendorffii TaxID=88036 RepID=D8SP69_SELML|nr:hypothetical protein SELMODRAFT_424220 [Selaginella moellendorffii]
MGVSSNLRYQALNGLEYFAAGVLSPAVFKTSVFAVRAANNVLGGTSFVTLARLTGSQRAEEAAAVAEKKIEGEEDEACKNKEGVVEHEFYEDDDYDRDFSMDGDSMVLLVQLVRTILRKLSSRATKAARGMLPPIFTSDLISFFVNGAVLLTVFWVAKALLEVVCSMGSMMFIGLLLVRSVWSILSYLQSQRYSGSFRNGNDRSNSNRRNMRGGGGGGDDFDDHHYRVSPS